VGTTEKQTLDKMLNEVDSQKLLPL